MPARARSSSSTRTASTPPHDAQALLAGLERFDLVVGSRFLGPTYRMPTRPPRRDHRLPVDGPPLGGLDLDRPHLGFRAMRATVAEASRATDSRTGSPSQLPDAAAS